MSTSADRAEVPRTPEERRQSLTTWGIVALAVFVAVGMGEWSKRSAANEVVMDPKILEQAMAIVAEARDSGVQGFKGEGISKFEFRNSKSENNLSDLSVSAVKPSSTAEAQSLLRQGYAGQGRGGVLGASGNEAATIQTSAGADR